jgi:hypothetical protein
MAAPDPNAEPLYEILRDPDAFSRAARLATFLAELGAESVPIARSTLEHPPPSGFGAVETVLITRYWATHQPAAATEWALRSWDGFRIAAALPAFELFVHADPQRALEALHGGGVVSSFGKQAYKRAFVRAWYESGQPGLVDYIRNLGMGIQRQRALSVLARATIRHEGPDAIIGWAESLSDGSAGPPRDADYLFKLEVFRQVSQELAIADPAVAVAWCERHCDGPFASTLRELIAQRWAAQDGLAAMQWIATAPPGRSTDWAVKSAAIGWWRNDRPGLDAYVAAMEESGIERWFQPALVQYATWSAGSLGEQAKREAIRLAALIEDPLKREKVLLAIARAWRKEDKATADAWLDQSPLSEDARERVRTHP